jgi:NAD(P)-dependent dehydrogenase (short-subunit alcohol dehydrogenase family)
VLSDRLEGVALVTGGGRGIGASIARELADAGMRVVVSGRTAESVESVAAEIGGIALVGDVSKPEDVERWVARAEQELGPVDLLVNNAGISGGGSSVLELPAEEWWHVFEVNTLGAFLCTQAAASRMAERGGGRIVNVGSGGSYLPVGDTTISSDTAYGASKAALGRFSEVIAAALRPLGIHVFLISPGLVRTDMTTWATARPGRGRSWRRASSACWPPDARTRSPAATSTPSTTTSRTSSAGRTRSRRTT